MARKQTENEMKKDVKHLAKIVASVKRETKKLRKTEETMYNNFELLLVKLADECGLEVCFGNGKLEDTYPSLYNGNCTARFYPKEGR